MTPPSGKRIPPKVTIDCPRKDCETATELTYSSEEDGYVGRCPECNMNVGAAYTKIFRDDAVARIREKLGTGKEKEKKDNSFW
jgi:hypothetical protein